MNALRTVGRDIVAIVLIGIALVAWLQPTIKVPDFVVMTIWITAAIVLVALALWLIVRAADLSFDRLGEFFQNPIAIGAGKVVLIVGFLVFCRFAVDVVYGSQIMADLKFSPPWRWFWSVMVVAVGALFPFQSMANWVVSTDGSFAKAVRRFVVVGLLGVVLFAHAKEGRTLKDNYESVKPFFAGIQLPERKPAPPPPPPAPEKKEKKIIAAAPAKEKRMRRATTTEEYTPRAYHVRALSGPFATPSGVATFKKGQRFELPAMGTGGCAALIPLEGEITLGHYGQVRNGRINAVGPGIGPITNCNNMPIVAEALTDATVFGGACPTAADKRCLFIN